MGFQRSPGTGSPEFHRRVREGPQRRKGQGGGRTLRRTKCCIQRGNKVPEIPNVFPAMKCMEETSRNILQNHHGCHSQDSLVQGVYSHKPRTNNNPYGSFTQAAEKNALL
uniref:Uncharacterized protein n=1 Tax=Pyxicephalus adspersus TaxID=30357 RepID=A0AAV2ZVB3_PYXAD|nr:TPA: hypothetical protein GDO54_003973 [Pyxicephalus adspersus]